MDALTEIKTTVGQDLPTGSSWGGARPNSGAVPLTMDQRISQWRDNSTIVEGGCWTWKGSTSSNGYGRVTFFHRLTRLHILSFNHFIGEVPAGLELDHTCRNRRCWNPEHLEPVTHIENCRRGRAGKHRSERTACSQGHPYTVDNTVIHQKGGHVYRACLTCLHRNAKAYRTRRRMRMEAK